MKKILSISLIILVMGLLGCNKPKKTMVWGTKQQKETHEKKIEEQYLLERNKEFKEQCEEYKIIEKKIPELEKNFIYEDNDFDTYGWYTHKTQTIKNSWNRKLLKAIVRHDGLIFLVDQFYGENWLFHSQIKVKIGSIIYDSDYVPPFKSNNHTEFSSGSIWEIINYDFNENNTNIIRAIAMSENVPIKIRFIGREYYADVVLAKRDKIAIKESYEFATLLMRKNAIYKNISSLSKLLNEKIN
jgi:hypothetical protein